MTISPAPEAENEAGPSTEPPVGVLRLRGGPIRRQRVMWTEETVDNEGMGKKKSKSECIVLSLERGRPEHSLFQFAVSTTNLEHTTSLPPNQTVQRTSRRLASRSRRLGSSARPAEGRRRMSAPSRTAEWATAAQGWSSFRSIHPFPCAHLRPSRPRRKGRSHHHDCNHDHASSHDGKANKYDHQPSGHGHSHSHAPKH